MAAPFNAVDGQKINLSIEVKDQRGNLITPTPAPDLPPVWTASNAAVDTLTVAADGMTATDLCVASGTDTVSLGVVYKGVSHSASMPLTVALSPPVPTSVDIVAA